MVALRRAAEGSSAGFEAILGLPSEIASTMRAGE